MRYLLDTNVISELQAKKQNLLAVQWLKSLSTEQIFFSVLTLGEISSVITNLHPRNPQRANKLAAWLNGLENQYSDHILPITPEIAKRWGSMNTVRTYPAIDSLIAATECEHGLILATRNVADFESLNVSIFNPFEE